nr:hypothetical protein [Tanacetum cinerariifolium]
MYEPDPKDQLWTLTQNYMHAPVEWKLYDLTGMHHVIAKDKEIFMLVEKDYPLRRGRMIPEPGDLDREVPVAKNFHEQSDEELTKKSKANRSK